MSVMDGTVGWMLAVSFVSSNGDFIDCASLLIFLELDERE